MLLVTGQPPGFTSNAIFQNGQNRKLKVLSSQLCKELAHGQNGKRQFSSKYARLIGSLLQKALDVPDSLSTKPQTILVSAVHFYG
jgi:hypothetical protein